MADPYDFTPLADHIRNVLSDYAHGGGDGLDDAVQAIMDHPEFAVAWDEYQKAHPKHGDTTELGGATYRWDAGKRAWIIESARAAAENP